MANIYAIVCSSAIMQMSEDAKEELVDRERQANQYFSAGKVGERINKRTGQRKTKNCVNVAKQNEDVRGSKINKLLIQKTIEMCEKVENMGIL